MPVVMNLRWLGVTPSQYDAARGAVGWERDLPAGAIYHVASFDDDGIFVTSVWENAEQFDDFVEKRLTPGAQQVGIVGEPEVSIRTVHAIFAPAYNVALPGGRDITEGAADRN